MRMLVTAGNTQVQIDRVRSITNIFTGKTGGRIALAAHEAGHAVTLLTSHPEVLHELGTIPRDDRWTLHPYRTFDDLEGLLESHVRTGNYDAIVHVAAVSDYRSAGVYRWQPGAAEPTLLDRAIGKIKSDEPELWLRLVRTPKLVDQMRTVWGFAGILVKFKLEVGLDDLELLAVAEKSRAHSQADLMVANTLDGADAWAYLGPFEGRYDRITRAELPARLLAAIDGLGKK
ncbi:MAG: bifunctional phosphopantothenoylcysteine decarboxylase/phosphopantothenate synthase [Gemmataceae bacterium]|nr:bifunctional phosphopantothenoylcysteine decarboxylase/phosphopantothenate synthase [Gemmataceae bacterium]